MTKVAAKILVIDDDADILNAARVVLRQKFETVETENNPQKINFLLNQNQYDVIILDMNYSAGLMSGKEGMFWLRQIKTINPKQSVIMVTAYADINLAVDAMKHGAADFIVKPWDNESLELKVKSVLSKSKEESRITPLVKTSTDEKSQVEFIGESKAIKDVLAAIEKVAQTDANVLILGENGTGKELIAKLVHQKSLRRSKPFVKVDVGSIASNLFESELFGHKKGAFTDAREDRTGRIEMANGGTLFLDEVGNVPLPLQAKLLSVLQNREVVPLGSNKSISIDIRLVCATNLNIRNAVSKNIFREDLLYRINTVEITLPALRNRAEDIPLLANHFLNHYLNKYRKEKKAIGNEALKFIQQYEWPGNVRELQHSVERAVIMSDNDTLSKQDFAIHSQASVADQDTFNLEERERQAIVAAIEKFKGNMSQVAKELGVGRTTLYRKLARYGLDQ